MTTFEMLLRVGTGVGLGTVIGFERQYRARMAGLRTNALVAVGATLFVLLSAHGFGGLSTTGAEAVTVTGAAAGYTIAATSKSGNHFTITKTAGGTARTCDSTGTSKGGCNSSGW